MDNQQPSISDFDLGWLCGIIDGEGCIGLWSRGGKRHQEYKPGVRITNTSKPLIDKVCALLDTLNVGHHVTYYGQRNERTKEYWTISVEGFKRVIVFLPIIKEKLVEKAPQAVLVFDWCYSRMQKSKRTPFSDFELSIPIKLAELNHRGIRK